MHAIWNFWRHSQHQISGRSSCGWQQWQNTFTFCCLCTDLDAFLRFIPGSIFIVPFLKHFLRCLCMIPWLKWNRNGSFPAQIAVAAAIVNKPQSSPSDWRWNCGLSIVLSYTVTIPPVQFTFVRQTQWLLRRITIWRNSVDGVPMGKQRLYSVNKQHGCNPPMWQYCWPNSVWAASMCKSSSHLLSSNMAIMFGVVATWTCLHFFLWVWGVQVDGSSNVILAFSSAVGHSPVGFVELGSSFPGERPLPGSSSHCSSAALLLVELGEEGVSFPSPALSC